MATSETKPRRSRLRDFWRIFFAIVGLLDCSCYCYCYHHRNEHSGEKNALAKHKKQPPRSCSRSEEWQVHDSYKHHHIFLSLHLLFGILCCVEMVLRAIEARRIVFKNQAITAFEEHLASTVAKVYRRRNLLRGKGKFSHFTLRRLSKFGTRVSSPITTGTHKVDPCIPRISFSSNNTIHEETEVDSDTNENDQNEDGQDFDIEEAANKRNILLFLRSTFKLWLPIGVTCLFWLSLLPFQAYYRIIRMFLNDFLRPSTNPVCAEGNHGEEFFCDANLSNFSDVNSSANCYVETLGDDTAFATLWITAFWVRWLNICEEIQDYMASVSRKYLLGGLFTTKAHRKLHNIFDRPKLIWFRFGRILNIVKWIRFAFPLTRMVMKLQDQLRTNYYTYKKVRSVRTNREKRLRHPSLLLEDLKRIQSFHKIETTIASWPSQCNILLDALAKEVSQISEAAHSRISSTMALAHAEEFLRKNRERGRQITRQIQRLKEQLRENMTEFSYSEIYDNILRLSQGVSKRNLFVDHGSSSVAIRPDDIAEEIELIQIATKTSHVRHQSHRSFKRRWYDFLHLQNLLSSREYLISPRSRFSVVWRITVTNCLLLELTRLSISWRLTQTFHLSLTQVIGRLFVDCGSTKEATRRNFKFITDIFEEWHAGLSRAIPLVPFPKDSLYILCVPTSNFSKILLLVGSAMETFIDVVSFLDIFFWFFTGDLDASTGLVVPKPFFGRCILPGTIAQVIDHPTLPDLLPSVMAKLASLASKVGWSRLVLWAFALFPALVAEVILPFFSYFFRHYEERNELDEAGGKNNSKTENDILMSYAESFGILPTRSRALLQEQVNGEDHSGESKSSGNDDAEDDLDSIDENISRWPKLMRRGILTPPGSPRRNLHHDSSVRLSNNLSMVSTKDSSEIGNNQQLLYDSANFDIGLSLSYQDLGDLNNDDL